MAKQQIFLVDADSSSARLLEVSLRSAGFTVATAASAEIALAKLEHGVPDLILTDTRLPGADGFAFVEQLRARPELAAVPVVFLTEQGALDDKLRGLELGVDDYLAKPIMVREVVTRVQLLLARKKQQRIAAEPLARTRFSGSLEDVAVVDLLQTIAVSGKSGVASVKRGEREAWLYFERGQIIDAEVGDLSGEEAVYRTITWTTGTFDLEFRAIERPRVIEVPHHALLMEGLRRVDELGRLAEQLPPENAIVDIDHEALASRLNEIPDELNGILRLIDGKRTLVDLIDASPFDDLSTLTVLSKFYFEGLLLSANPEPVEWAPGSRPDAAARRPSLPPSSGGAEPSPTLIPPSRSLDTSQTPRGPRVAEPAREARTLAPAPTTSRAANDPDAKLTPKGIVNVGDSTPSPPKSMPSPFRVANDAPRRSPIPMPDGSSPRSNGAPAPHANGAPPSRTMFGLSASATGTAEPAADSPRFQAPPSSQSRSEAEVSRTSLDRRHSHDTPSFTPSPPSERSTLDAPSRPAGASSATPASSAPSSSSAKAARGAELPGSAPGSNPESEQQFFEAGDEGTYVGGPRSSLPVPHFEHDAAESSVALQRGNTPSRHARTQRSLAIVAGVLVLAALALIVAAWRHFGTEQPAAVNGETNAVAPPQPFAPEAVKQPGNTGDVVASTPSPVSPQADSASLGADAAAPTVDGSAPPRGMPEAPAAAVDATARPAPAPQGAPAFSAPKALAVQRPRAPAKPSPAASSAPLTKPSGGAETPFIPPFEAAPSQVQSKPVEKPPTAAYPLH